MALAVPVYYGGIKSFYCMLSLCVPVWLMCLVLSPAYFSLVYGTTAKRQSLFNDTARIVQLVYSIDVKKSLVENLYFAIRPCLEIALVKVMHTNVSVLSSGCVCGPCRMHSNTVSNKTSDRKRNVNPDDTEACGCRGRTCSMDQSVP